MISPEIELSLSLSISQPCFPFFCLHVSLMQASSKWSALAASVLHFTRQETPSFPRVPAIVWVLHISVIDLNNTVNKLDLIDFTEQGIKKNSEYMFV